MQSLEQPLPCPFCGKQPVKSKHCGDERNGYADVVKLTCPGCGCSQSAQGDTSKGGYADNRGLLDKALAKWNTRIFVS